MFITAAAKMPALLPKIAETCVKNEQKKALTIETRACFAVAWGIKPCFASMGRKQQFVACRELERCFPEKFRKKKKIIGKFLIGYKSVGGF
ncbi:MAG: hypothetical protein ACWA5K_02735 [bacterium]